MAPALKNFNSFIGWTKLRRRINGEDSLRQEHRHVLEETVTYSCNVSNRLNNIFKNKLLIPCYDYNQVVLPTKSGQRDYINASWIRCHIYVRQMICSESPLKETVNDFWRMVWANKAQIIVMMTNTHEGDQETCFQYWSPAEETTVTYGTYRITTKKIRTCSSYIVTSFRVTNEHGDVLDVEQYNFIDWPRGGVPSKKNEFLNFVLDVRQAQVSVEIDAFVNPEQQLPTLLVHSTTGQNRAGAFCFVDICMSQYEKSGIVLPVSTLCLLREQRYNCLHLSKQYIFCRKVVQRYINLMADKAKK